MNRVPLTEVVLKAADLTDSNSAPARFAQRLEVFVYERGTEDEVTLYSAESGGEALPQPLTTDGSGRPRSEGKTVWVEEGSYDLAAAGQVVPWEASSGTLPPSVATRSDGTAPTPGYSFEKDPDTGLYRIGDNRMGVATGGICRVYFNNDGALIVPDTAAGDPLELSAGTAPGSIVTGMNRFYRTINAARNGTVRLIGCNTSNDIVIGGEGGSGDNGAIVIRSTATYLERGGKEILLVKEGEIVGKQPLVLESVVKANYGTHTSGSSAFVTKVEGDTSDRLEIRNNGTIVVTNGAGTTGYTLNSSFSRQAYTQTFSEVTHTHSAVTSNAVATTEAVKGEFGFTEAQANAIPVAINAVRADLLNLKKVVNGIIDDMQSLGVAT